MPHLHSIARIRAALVLLLIFCMAACNDATLTKVGKALDDTAIAVKQLQTAVIQANAQKLVSDQTTYQILLVCNKINVAGLEASKATRAYSQMPPGGKPTLTAIVNPLVAAVNDALQNGLLGITDQTTKNTVQGILTTIQAGLAAAQIALGGK